MKLETAPLQSLIKDIIIMRNALKDLLGKGKPYEQLLNFIISNYNSEDENYVSPMVKELSSKTNIPYSKLKKQLHQLYSEILELAEKGDLFTIQKRSYLFEAKYCDQYLSVKYYDIPNVPIIGEQVCLSCFYSSFHRSDFYVDSITYEYYADEVITVIRLETGTYNSFYRLKLDEADFKDIFSIHDFYCKSKYELKKMMLEKMRPYHNSLSGSS